MSILDAIDTGAHDAVVATILLVLLVALWVRRTSGNDAARAILMFWCLDQYGQVQQCLLAVAS